MNRLPFVGLLLALLCFVSCRQMNDVHLLHLAEKQVEMNVDSIYVLLAQIEKPSQLSGEDRLLYGWLNAYVHYKWQNSMTEDSLLLPASGYYAFCNDTVKNLLSYQLKAWYWYWLKKHEQCIAAIDSGIALAKALQDTGRMVDMLSDKAYWYVYVWKDYDKAIETFRAAIAQDVRAENLFSMGIAMGLNKNDSAAYYMERSIKLAVQSGDTNRIVYYLRNYAQLQAYSFDEPSGAIAAIRRMEQYVIDPVQLRMGDLVKVEVFLKEGLIDSAEYYLDKERERSEGRNRFLTEENMVAVYRALIDYTRYRTFDILDVARYNDSVANALAAVQSTVRRKDESKETLSQANLILTVERKQAQLNLLLALLVLVLVGGGAFLYIRNRRNRLIEAEERAETLTRLLEDATKSQSKEEDGQFFRKILLQQLGMIRLVAKQPTLQNQELLRRIFCITSHELPVESLLVWEDLYPIIDRIYDNFYTKMNSRFGDVLIDKEKQLCCLLCADFSTKEISVVTQQSIPTIYQRKTNIRKKLGMGEKEGIVEFIGSI
ncbi:hypothetical protein [uncultured Bacteroides sp.]|uniref:helix-turn-helix transcriptional regulator n=1 Tax=uncultured Bacteroides sp. TaxID=162156 RepID=UPI00280BC6D0|nr:hypothetical protein [uncultured Bacteroides sp.]